MSVLCVQFIPHHTIYSPKKRLQGKERKAKLAPNKSTALRHDQPDRFPQPRGLRPFFVQTYVQFNVKPSDSKPLPFPPYLNPSSHHSIQSSIVFNSLDTQLPHAPNAPAPPIDRLQQHPSNLHT
jgi:hypothetical protein